MFILGMRKSVWYIVLLLCCALQVKAQSYHIGDFITTEDGQQGVVFYINPERTGGWMVALHDVTKNGTNKFKWGDKQFVLQPAAVSVSESTYYLVQSSDNMSGKERTFRIRNKFSNHDFAAWVVNSNNQPYFGDDWYLPSVRELQYLYSSLAVVDSVLSIYGSCMSNDVYWSSTEKDKDNAWAISFKNSITNGSPVYDPGQYSGGGFWFHGKDQKHCVRAIHDFTMPSSSDNFSYLWNTGETTPEITVAPAQSTPYSVTVSLDGGCETTETATVYVASPPVVEITISPSDTICEGDEITLTAEVLNPAVGDILCSDGSIVKASKWPVAGKTAKGIVFYVDPSGQHGWAVSVTESQKAWCNKSTVDIPDLANYTNWIPAINDFNGYENTQKIHNAANSNTTYAAVDYVLGLGSVGGHSWYLPALGQLNVLYASVLIVNQSLQRVNGTVFTESLTAHLWSSNEINEGNAFKIQCNNGGIDKDLKSKSNRVRAIIDF